MIFLIIVNVIDLELFQDEIFLIMFILIDLELLQDEMGNSTTTESPSTTLSPEDCDQFKTDQSCELDESNIIKVFLRFMELELNKYAI